MNRTSVCKLLQPERRISIAVKTVSQEDFCKVWINGGTRMHAVVRNADGHIEHKLHLIKTCLIECLGGTK